MFWKIMLGAAALTLAIPLAALSGSSADAQTPVQPNVTNNDTWAGYLAHGKNGFYAAQSDWTVSAVSCQPAQTARSAAWIGLGGWNGSTSYQVGTEANCNADGTQTYYAWSVISPKQTPRVLQRTVEPGDKMYMQVAVPGYACPDQFAGLLIVNHTQGWEVNRCAKDPHPSNSVQCIVERPPFAGGGDTALADFGSVDFGPSYGCIALYKDDQGTVYAWPLAEKGVTLPPKVKQEQINMVSDMTGDTLATTSNRKPSVAFSVTWHESQ